MNEVPPTSPPEGTPGGQQWPHMNPPNWTSPGGQQRPPTGPPRWTPPSTWGTRPTKPPRWTPPTSWRNPPSGGRASGLPNPPAQRMFVLRPGLSFWVGLSGILLLGLLGAVSSGLGSALWFMSLVPFVTGLVALIRRRRTLWFGSTTDGGVAALL